MILEKYTTIHQLYKRYLSEIRKSFNIFFPKNPIPDILIEEDLDTSIQEKVNHKDSLKSETGTYESVEELKILLEKDSDQQIVIFLTDLNEKERNDPRVRAMFKRSSPSNISLFITSHD